MELERIKRTCRCAEAHLREVPIPIRQTQVQADGHLVNTFLDAVDVGTSLRDRVLHYATCP